MKTIIDDTTFISSKDIGWEIWNRTEKMRAVCERDYCRDLYFQEPEKFNITCDDVFPAFTINKSDDGWQILLLASYKGEKISFGTVKCKSYGYKALKAMTRLYREVVYEFYELLNQNVDSFRREGFDITIYGKDEQYPTKKIMGVPSIDTAMLLVNMFLGEDDVNRCMMRDNLTRSQQVFAKENVV